ncbi:hypothetical protein V8J36_07370 [Frigidibacter sp. MR17.14]|uniref:hypothetical protein n=1 Tax=Frigidibacter sp. MR17.14 TaxID=3126509 RepID=UPI003012D7AD
MKSVRIALAVLLAAPLPAAPALAAGCPVGQVMVGTSCQPIGQNRLPSKATGTLNATGGGAPGLSRPRLPNAEATRQRLRTDQAIRKAQPKLRP